jgi:hypothetical protein
MLVHDPSVERPLARRAQQGAHRRALEAEAPRGVPPERGGSVTVRAGVPLHGAAGRGAPGAVGEQQERLRRLAEQGVDATRRGPGLEPTQHSAERAQILVDPPRGAPAVVQPIQDPAPCSGRDAEQQESQPTGSPDLWPA